SWSWALFYLLYLLVLPSHSPPLLNRYVIVKPFPLIISLASLVKIFSYITQLHHSFLLHHLTDLFHEYLIINRLHYYLTKHKSLVQNEQRLQQGYHLGIHVLMHKEP